MHKNFYDPFGGNLHNGEINEARIDLERDRLRRHIQKREILSAGFNLGFGIILCLVIQTIMSLIIKALDVSDLYLTDPIFFSAFNSLAVSIMSIAVPFGIIALVNKKHYIGPIVPTKKIGFFNGFTWVGFGLMACVFINYFVGVIIVIAKNLGYELGNAKTPKVDSPFACVMLIISAMIMPAICEEFSMRCCAMGLLKKHGKSFAVFAVSIIFGLLHGNIIQFMFAFLVGGVLAYVTMKTDNIVPAIVIHALSNGRSVMYDIINYASGEQLADKGIVVSTIVIIVIGALSTVILLIKDSFGLDFKKSFNDCLSFGQKLLYLLPGLGLPLLLLIMQTITTIKKL